MGIDRYLIMYRLTRENDIWKEARFSAIPLYGALINSKGILMFPKGCFRLARFWAGLFNLHSLQGHIAICQAAWV